MAQEQAPDAPQDAGSELPTDRCPNCGGPLKSFWDQPEALCPKCRIFVEILRPGGTKGSPSEPVAEGLVHRLGLAKYHLMSEELDEEELADEPQNVELEAGPPERYPPAPPASLREPSPSPSRSEDRRRARKNRPSRLRPSRIHRFRPKNPTRRRRNRCHSPKSPSRRSRRWKRKPLPRSRSTGSKDRNY